MGLAASLPFSEQPPRCVYTIPPAGICFVSTIERAAHAAGSAVENVGVPHGCGDVPVAEQLLDGADIGAGLEQMGGERVALMPSSA